MLQKYLQACKYTIRLTFKYCLIAFEQPESPTEHRASKTTWKPQGGSCCFHWSLVPIFQVVVDIIGPTGHWDTIEKEHVELTLATSSSQKSETHKHHLLDAPKDGLWPSERGKKEKERLSLRFIFLE